MLIKYVGSFLDSSIMLQCGRFNLSLQRPLVMGIVNVTADSFSDGGRFQSLEQALAHAHQLIEEGADILDLGAESTRPGAQIVPLELEAQRLLPLIKELQSCGIPLSVDTYKPDMMRLALEHGADMINDVQGFGSLEARQAVTGSHAALCIMHMQGTPQTMQLSPSYQSVVAQVSEFLSQQVNLLLECGISSQQLCIDPGFGFGKAVEHNYQLLNQLLAIQPTHIPRLIGVSRKSMIGHVTGKPVEQRMAPSVALALAGVVRGASIIRVHDVAATVDALKVWDCVNHPTKVTHET